jgi:NAD(P)-dependent dehydrogenase (short-subunit alcohol dehydrogenase family)
MRVLITNAMSDQGVVVAQSLGRAGCEIVGVDRRAAPRWLRTKSLRELQAVPHADPRRWQEDVLRASVDSRQICSCPSAAEACSWQRSGATSLALAATFWHQTARRS